jgi:hypothetical protein
MHHIRPRVDLSLCFSSSTLRENDMCDMITFEVRGFISAGAGERTRHGIDPATAATADSAAAKIVKRADPTNPTSMIFSNYAFGVSSGCQVDICCRVFFHR